MLMSSPAGEHIPHATAKSLLQQPEPLAACYLLTHPFLSRLYLLNKAVMPKKILFGLRGPQLQTAEVTVNMILGEEKTPLIYSWICC